MRKGADIGEPAAPRATRSARCPGARKKLATTVSAAPARRAEASASATSGRAAPAYAGTTLCQPVPAQRAAMASIPWRTLGSELPAEASSTAVSGSPGQIPSSRSRDSIASTSSGSGPSGAVATTAACATSTARAVAAAAGTSCATW